MPGGGANCTDGVAIICEVADKLQVTSKCNLKHPNMTGKVTQLYNLKHPNMTSKVTQLYNLKDPNMTGKVTQFVTSGC